MAVVSFSSLPRSLAQDAAPEYIPDDCIATVTLWPQVLRQRESMEYAPWEILAAAGFEQFGFDPANIRRVDALMLMPGNRAPAYGAILQVNEPLELAKIQATMIDGSKSQDLNGIRVCKILGTRDVYCHQAAPQTLLVGTPDCLAQMLATKSDPPQLAGSLAGEPAEQDLLVLVEIGPLREMVLHLLRNTPGGNQLPAEVDAEFQGLLNSVDLLSLRANLTDHEKLQFSMNCPSNAAAEAAGSHIASLLKLGNEAQTQAFAESVPKDTATGRAIIAYMDRYSTDLAQAMQPQVQGDKLTLEFENFRSAAVIASLSGMLIPGTMSARQAARRMQSSNNLKQCALAMHNFDSAYRSLPATAAKGDDGSPLYSWRVAILPFIEEQALYEEFNMDEPWDSEHNIALLERMPDVFRHPDKPTKPGYTVYQAPVGKDTALRLDEPSRFADMTDGTSNTIMIVETNPKAAVPWTAPQDWEVDHNNPDLDKLFFKELTQAAFADGSVRAIPRSIAIETLKALLTRSGGERVGAW